MFNYRAQIIVPSGPIEIVPQRDLRWWTRRQVLSFSESSEHEGCLNAVGHGIVFLTSVYGLVCSYRFPLRHELSNYVGDPMRRRAECLAKCEALSSTGCELVTEQSYDKRVLNHYTTQGGVDSAP